MATAVAEKTPSVYRRQLNREIQGLSPVAAHTHLMEKLHRVAADNDDEAALEIVQMIVEIVESEYGRDLGRVDWKQLASPTCVQLQMAELLADDLSFAERYIFPTYIPATLEWISTRVVEGIGAEIDEHGARMFACVNEFIRMSWDGLKWRGEGTPSHIMLKVLARRIDTFPRAALGPWMEQPGAHAQVMKRLGAQRFFTSSTLEQSADVLREQLFPGIMPRADDFWPQVIAAAKNTVAELVALSEPLHLIGQEVYEGAEYRDRFLGYTLVSLLQFRLGTIIYHFELSPEAFAVEQQIMPVLCGIVQQHVEHYKGWHIRIDVTQRDASTGLAAPHAYYAWSTSDEESRFSRIWHYPR